jgi:Calx-beta domain
MKRNIALLKAWLGLLLCLALVINPYFVSAQSHDVRPNVIAGGGNTSTGSGNLQISGTVGQSAAGTPLSGGDFTQRGGFWHALAGTPASLPAVQLNAIAYTVGEGTSQLLITLSRSGNTGAALSARFATFDAGSLQDCQVATGVASARCDYLTSIRTIRFAAGEPSRVVSVSIIDDSYFEGTETFNISVSDPAGLQSNATVTIIDNESTTGPNPIDLTNFFVRLQYLDSLNREPDVSGFDFWTSQITSCGNVLQCLEVKRINVSASFYLSIEFQETGFLVERLYRAAYGSEIGNSTQGGPHQITVPILRLHEFLSDTQEIGDGVVVKAPGWEAALEANKQAFIAGFVARSRFVTKYPLSMSPAQFVDVLNTNAGSALSQLERDQLVNDLGLGIKTRAQVLRAIAEDPDLFNAEFTRAFVLLQYFGYLRRNPNDAPDSDYSGYDFWLTKLNQFNGNFSDAEMVKAFLHSAEYRRRVGP